MVAIQAPTRHFLIFRDLKLSFRGLREILEVRQVVVTDSRRLLHFAVIEPVLIAKCAHFRRFSLHLGRIKHVLVRNVRNKLF